MTAWVKIASESGDDWGGFRACGHQLGLEALAQTGWLLKKDRGEWFKVAFTFSATTPQTRLQVIILAPRAQMAVDVDDLAVFVKGANKPPEVAASLTP